MYWAKPTANRLMWFYPMWLTLLASTIVDIAMVGGDEWEYSIMNTNTEKSWILGGDFVNLTAVIYNLCILMNMRKM